MTTQTEKIAAAETVAAGLRLLLEFGEREGMPPDALAPLRTVEQGITAALPPWEPERSEIPSTWGAVSPGDQVKAPNGEWYEVDAWSRIGGQVKVLLKGGIRTTQDAATSVAVRRGAEGRALDVFAAAGMTLERIGR